MRPVPFLFLHLLARDAALHLIALLPQDGNLERCLKALQHSLELSSQLDEPSGDVDVLGAIGDTYTDLGDLEEAAEVSCMLCCCYAKGTRLSVLDD